MEYNEIIKQISEKLDLPSRVVDKTYRAYWLFIRDSISSLPLKGNLTQEDFGKLKTNFNIPSLGKLNCTFDRVQRMKQRYKFIKDLRNKC